MNSLEKAESLKNTIYQLYVNEGRSKSYISRLLEINRKTITDKIKEWGFPEPKTVRHPTPSTEKFIRRNRTLIKSRLDNDVPVTEIARELGVERGLFRTVFYHDQVLRQANEDRMNRVRKSAELRRQDLMDSSRLIYYTEDLPGEEWRVILGYPEYMISNKGRVRSYAKAYNAWYLLRQYSNHVCDGRMYVSIKNDKGKMKTLSVARIVAHNFVDGYSAVNCTVNHIDGNVQNNDATNLEWVSQEVNNIHAYRVLNRKASTRRRIFRKIILNNKYEFKTIRALAKFMNISEAQAHRYMDDPEKHGIAIVS